mmetsp:Transcript_2062/g.4999  ORF Transcript_2062/g.4999 Transcript_2062/m.4999 type:complete len:273 (+) Transcript_2062:461-1279(+)
MLALNELRDVAVSASRRRHRTTKQDRLATDECRWWLLVQQEIIWEHRAVLAPKVPELAQEFNLLADFSAKLSTPVRGVSHKRAECLQLDRSVAEKRILCERRGLVHLGGDAVVLPKVLHDIRRCLWKAVADLLVEDRFFAMENAKVYHCEERLQKRQPIRRRRVRRVMEHVGALRRQLGTKGVAHESDVRSRVIAHGQSDGLDAQIPHRLCSILERVKFGFARLHVETLPSDACVAPVEPYLLLGVTCTVLVGKLVPIEHPEVPTVVDPRVC